MTLDLYLSENAIKGVDFAATLGISEASLTRIRRGEQNISRDLIRRIVEATGGAVTSDALVFHGAEAAGEQEEASGHAQLATTQGAQDHGKG